LRQYGYLGRLKAKLSASMEGSQSPTELSAAVHGSGAVGGAAVTDSRIAISARSVRAAPFHEGAAERSVDAERRTCGVPGGGLRCIAVAPH